MTFTNQITGSFYGGGSAFFTGSSAVSALVPHAYHCAINGRPYMLDLKNNSLVGPASIPALAAQQDNGGEAGESSLSRDDVWRRTFSSWHHGMGQTWHDNADSDSARFRTSRGVDPWTKNRLSLLPSTNIAATPTNATCAVVAPGASSWRYYYDANDFLVYRSTTVNGGGTATFASTTVTGNSTSGGNPNGPWRPICTDGTNVYVVSSIDAAALAVKKIGVSATTTHFSGGDAGNPNFIAWAKGRLMVGHTVSGIQKLYDLTGGTASSTLTIGDANAVMMDAVEAGSYIWLGTRSSTVSRIYRIAADSSTGALTLDGVGLTLPSGEDLYSIFGYENFVFVGSNLGWRCCQVDGTTLTMGPLVKDATHVQCWAARGQYVWFGWTQMDSSTGGLGRIDLGTFVDTLTPAYTTDITAAVTGTIVAAFVTGNQSATGDLNRPIVQFFTNSELVETDNSDYVTSGTLSTGYINYGITDQKTGVAIEVRNEALTVGAIAMSLANFVGATAASVDTVNAQGATGQTMTVNNIAGSEHELMVTITSSGTTSPALTNVTLLVHPAPKSGQYWVLPLLFADVLQCLDGVPRPFDYWDELRRLRLLRSPSTSPAAFQIGNQTFTVFVDDYENHPDRLAWGKGSYQSTCIVKLKELVGVTA